MLCIDKLNSSRQCSGARVFWIPGYQDSVVYTNKLLVWSHVWVSWFWKVVWMKTIICRMKTCPRSPKIILLCLVLVPEIKFWLCVISWHRYSLRDVVTTLFQPIFLIISIWKKKVIPFKWQNSLQNFIKPEVLETSATTSPPSRKII